MSRAQTVLGARAGTSRPRSRQVAFKEAGEQSTRRIGCSAYFFSVPCLCPDAAAVFPEQNLCPWPSPGAAAWSHRLASTASPAMWPVPTSARSAAPGASAPHPSSDPEHIAASHAGNGSPRLHGPQQGLQSMFASHVAIGPQQRHRALCRRTRPPSTCGAGPPHPVFAVPDQMCDHGHQFFTLVEDDHLCACGSARASSNSRGGTCGMPA